MSLATCKDSSQVPEKHDLIVYVCRIYPKEKTNFLSNNWYCYSETILRVCVCACVWNIYSIVYTMYSILCCILQLIIYFIYTYKATRHHVCVIRDPNFQCKRQITHIKSKKVTKISVILNWKCKYSMNSCWFFFLWKMYFLTLHAGAGKRELKKKRMYFLVLPTKRLGKNE